jgi:hypothetical protein
MRYRWCRGVWRLDDEVAEGGTEVECLEDGVGVTEQEGEKLEAMRWLGGTYQVFPNFAE